MGKYSFNSDIRRSESVNWIIFIALFLLGFVGLFVLSTTNSGLFWQQSVYLLLGAIIIYVISRLDPVVLWWFAPYGYMLSVLLIAATYFSPAIRGASRWIQIGPSQLQPSELVKPFLVLAFARAMATYSPRQLKWMLLHGILFFIPFFLVFKQPDLGTALVYGAVWITMSIGGGLSLTFLSFCIMLISVGFPYIWQHLAEFQKNRITTFLNPALDPSGAGYNALQSMIAVGSGQLFGRGLGRGTQSHLRFLPEFHTDFIFATLIEELGFAGGITLLFLYAVLLWQLMKEYIKGLVGSTFLFFYTTGLFAMILSQVVINTGMNMGIIPVTGITLPLVSYGGSSILSLSLAFGMLLALRKDQLT